jgi:hypothetical protein
MRPGLPPGSILDRLSQVRRLDPLTPRQACPELVEGSAIVRVSLRMRRTPREFVVGPGAHLELLHGGPQQALAGIVQRAELAHFGRANPWIRKGVGVGERVGALEAAALGLAGGLDARLDGGAASASCLPFARQGQAWYLFHFTVKGSVVERPT